MTSNTVIESVLSARYYHGNEKNWSDVCKRVSDFVGNNDEERISFYELMKDCDFIPNSPTLFNAGLPNGQLSACFVLPVHDSLSCIFDTLKQCALIFKSGGGVGMSFGEIRPKNSAVGDSNGVASGAVSFMRVYDSAIEAIKAGGKRRGAAMGVLPCDHGDIMEFIECKSKEGVIKNFNLSVMMTKEFMDKVKCKQWGDIVTYTILDDGTKRAVTVGEVWHGIVEGSHRNGEPAVLFDDNINEANALKQLGKIVSTNPCGEQLLLPFESCNLGSINLSHYVQGNEIDYVRLAKDTRICTKFLNNVLDKNMFPISELKQMNDKTRKIGLGIMGYHDMLLKLHIAYDSDEALNLLTKVLRVLFDSAKDESHKLALKYGVFPAFDDSEWDIPMRNGALTCVAPTGSISLLANCSSGIEPVFNWVYQRNNTVGKSFLMVHPLFDADLKKMCDGDSDLYDEIINLVFHDGTLQNISMIPDKVKAVYKCALDISPEWHLKTLACAQKIVDASISKTINLPHHTTKSQVEKILIDAHDMGCKGVTVYRTGSRKDVVMSSSITSESGFIEMIKDGNVYVKCPECGHLTLGHGGCNVCESCGFTKCS